MDQPPVFEQVGGNWTSQEGVWGGEQGVQLSFLEANFSQVPSSPGRRGVGDKPVRVCGVQKEKTTHRIFIQIKEKMVRGCVRDWNNIPCSLALKSAGISECLG